MNTKSVIIAVLLTVIALLFAMFNVQAVTTNIFFGNYDISLAFIWGLGLLLGIFITLLLNVPPLFSAKRKEKEAKGKLGILEKMLQDNIVRNNALQAQIDEINQKADDDTIDA